MAAMPLSSATTTILGDPMSIGPLLDIVTVNVVNGMPMTLLGEAPGHGELDNGKATTLKVSVDPNDSKAGDETIAINLLDMLMIHMPITSGTHKNSMLSNISVTGLTGGIL